MKKENKVQIHSVLDLLSARDPWWNDCPEREHKLEVLYNSWRQSELRAKRHSGFFYSDAWKRGWLSQTDFNRFRDYVLC